MTEFPAEDATATAEATIPLSDLRLRETALSFAVTSNPSATSESTVLRAKAFLEFLRTGGEGGEAARQAGGQQ